MFHVVKNFIFCNVLNVQGSLQSIKLPPFMSRIKNGCAVAVDSHTVLLIGGWDESRTSSAVFKCVLLFILFVFVFDSLVFIFTYC